MNSFHQPVLNRVFVSMNDFQIECQELKISKTFNDLALFTVVQLGKDPKTISHIFFLDVEHTKRIPLE